MMPPNYDDLPPVPDLEEMNRRRLNHYEHLFQSIKFTEDDLKEFLNDLPTIISFPNLITEVIKVLKRIEPHLISADYFDYWESALLKVVGATYQSPDLHARVSTLLAHKDAYKQDWKKFEDYYARVREVLTTKRVSPDISILTSIEYWQELIHSELPFTREEVEQPALDLLDKAIASNDLHLISRAYLLVARMYTYWGLEKERQFHAKQGFYYAVLANNETIAVALMACIMPTHYDSKTNVSLVEHQLKYMLTAAKLHPANLFVRALYESHACSYYYNVKRPNQRYDLALEHAENACELCLMIGDLHQRINSQLQLAACYYQIKDMAAAQKAYERLLVTLENTKNEPYLPIIALHGLGCVERELNLITEALQHLREAEKLTLALPLSDWKRHMLKEIRSDIDKTNQLVKSS